MLKIRVSRLYSQPVESLEVEVVERKGLGHPDSLCDHAAEAASVSLSKYYQEMFGGILHHNVDKALLVGGRAKVEFGGGEILEPITFILAGRATTEVATEEGLETIPAEEIAVKSVKEEFGRSLRFLDVEKHLVVKAILRPGSTDLRRIFEEGRRQAPLSNDTSLGVGFAPLTEMERIVLEGERYLNSKKFKEKLPEVGEDIKVMGLREKEKITLTVAAAIIAPLTPDKDHYVSVKEQIEAELSDLASTYTSKEIEVKVNVGDNYEKGIYYLTLTGTSAESGDDGQVGRGNRCNGLITPNRPMSMEATAGKNPYSHIGKIYNVLAGSLANRIVVEIDAVKEAYTYVLGQIGKRIDDPLVVSLQLVVDPAAPWNNIQNEAQEIAKEEVSKVTNITKQILERQALLF
ncbi:MAG: methionine adenosyltransferase [Candidatus Freyarchaeota archaeon]|nr:methionine adenosyltransferase [Candidatus Jordarchaeia archaeon]